MELKAHRAVLAIASPVFRVMLNSPMKEGALGWGGWGLGLGGEWGVFFVFFLFCFVFGFYYGFLRF